MECVVVQVSESACGEERWWRERANVEVRDWASIVGIHIHKCTHTHTHSHTCTHTRTHTHAHTHTRTHIYTQHTHTCTYTYIHTQIDTHV